MACTTKRSYTLEVCCKILGMMLFSCLSTEVACHTVQWPSGKYGLPMAKSGCPKANGFDWETGYIYQDLEDDKSQTQTSSSFHLNATVFSSGDVSRRFCFKMNRSATVDNNRFRWPAGQYCIYKKGASCPKPLQSGWVLWDDENGKSGANLNFQSGTVPAGSYKQDTKIYFCCQTIGSSSDPIELPIESPFYLIAYNSRSCQEVLKTIHTLEYIRYDTENDVNHDSQDYPYPYGADLSRPYIYYCYYQACRWTKTSLTGSFWSPSYPKTYKEMAWCEWYINVPWNYIISLTFLDFRLEMTSASCVTASCDCDYVEVQENFSNGTSAIVGKYCMGGAYPHGVIRTRSNNITVTFRSDFAVGSEGFKARYDAIQVTAPTSLGSTTKETQATSPTVVSTVNPATFPLTGPTIQGTTSGSSTSSSTSSIDSNTTTTTATTTSNSTGTTGAATTSNSTRTTAATTLSNSTKTTAAATTSNSTRTTAAAAASNSSTTTAGVTISNSTRTTAAATTSNSSTTTAVATTSNSTTTTAETTASKGTSTNPETSWTTGEKTSARPSEPTEETSATTLATEQHEISPTGSSGEKERAPTATANDDGVQRVRNENPGTARNVYVIAAVTASVIVISAVVAGSIFCLCRKRRLKRKQTDHDRLRVAFRAAEKKGGVANGVSNIYGSSGENAEEEYYSYIDHKKEQLNILYDNRAFTYSDEKLEEDDEIKESDNPLYSSSVEIEQDENRNVLYESMDEVTQNVIEAETVNPVYERFA